MNKKQTIYMVGVGGMGMAPLAVYLSKIGNTVHGFDDSLSEQVREILDRSGVIISSNLDGLESGELLVYSSAISHTSPHAHSSKEGWHSDYKTWKHAS